jgi:hypothetical protein
MRNNAVNRSRNPRGSRRNNPRRTRRGPQMNSILRGNTFRVNPDPPSTVDRPWNSVVLSFNAAAAGNISVTVVRDAFRAQVGAGTTTPAIEFRFIQLRAWELSGANLGVQIYDLDSSSFEPHRTQHDEPGRNHWATCGLQWAVNQQMNTFDDSSLTNIAAVSTSATTANILVHLHILWRFSGTPAPTKLHDLIPTFNRLLAIKATEEEDLTTLPSLEDSACQA